MHLTEAMAMAMPFFALVFHGKPDLSQPYSITIPEKGGTHRNTSCAGMIHRGMYEIQLFCKLDLGLNAHCELRNRYASEPRRTMPCAGATQHHSIAPTGIAK